MKGIQQLAIYTNNTQKEKRKEKKCTVTSSQLTAIFQTFKMDRFIYMNYKIMAVKYKIWIPIRMKQILGK